jgi:probable F420-dependent oxidoreductase
MQRLGVSLPLDGFSLQECIELAEHAESLGYTDVWTSEIGGADGFTLLGAIAARTERMRLGAGVIPVYTRPPALIAMSAAAVQEISGGRFCLGLGTSTEVVVNQWMGLQFEHPLTRIRETIEAIQLALSCSKVSFEGETIRMQDFRLQLPDVDVVPIMLGALGPKMIRLAGEIADGLILSQTALPGLPGLLEEFWAAVAESGRDQDDVDVVLRVAVAMDEDEDVLRAVFQRELAGYGRTKVYNQFFERQGYVAEADGIREAWSRRDGRAAAAAVSDQMMNEVFVFGTPGMCRQRLNAYCEAGVRTPVIIPVSVHPDQEERNKRRIQVLESVAVLVD